MKQVLQILQENQIPQAIRQFEQFNIQNEGAQILLEKINDLYTSNRNLVCQWIVDTDQIETEYKFLAYNILGCTLEQEDLKIENFRKAISIALKNNFDVSDPLINIQKAYLHKQQFDKVLRCFKYFNLIKGRYKIVAIYNVSKAYQGLQKIGECFEYSKKAYEESLKIFGINDPMTKRMEQYFNLINNNKDSQTYKQISNQDNQIRRQHQSQLSDTSSIFGNSFSQFDNDLSFNTFSSKSNNSKEQSITVEFSCQNREICSLDNQNLCCELIKEFFRFADLKIQIKNIQSNSINEILQKKYQKLPLQINYQEQEDENIQQPLNLNQYQVQNYSEVQNNKIYTYQIKAQQENYLSQQDIMIYIQAPLIRSFLIESAQKDFIVKLDDKLYQYQVSPISKSKQKQDEVSQFFWRLKNMLDNIIILTTNFQSQNEAINFQSILKQNKIKKKLCDLLSLNDFELYLSSEIDLKDFQCYSNLQQQALNLKTKTYQIILIIKCVVQFSNIKQMQQQFQEFALKSRNLQLIKEQFQLELEFNPDSNVIDKKIKQLQQREEQFEISISQPQLKIGSKKMFVVDSTIQFWMDRNDQSNQEVQQMFKRIIDSIQQIFFPSLKLILSDTNQIKLWQNFLYQFYINNPKEGCTLNNQYVLEFKGESNLIEAKYKLIEQDLQEYQFNQLNFEVQDKIAKVLKEKQQIQKQYKLSLDQIAKQFSKCLIQIVGISDNKIQVDTYINNQTTLNNIQLLLQQQFFQNLNIYTEKNIEIEDICAFLGVQKEQFKNQYQVVVQKNKNEYNFIGQNKDLEEIKKIVEQTKKYKQENRKTKIIECPNILVFNHLKEQHQQSLKIENQDIQILYSQNQTIILQGINQQQLIDKSNSISQDILKLENELITKTCIIKEKLLKFFEKNFKQYYTTLENSKKASIKFQEKNKYSIISQVLQSNKKLQLIKGEITQLECDAIFNFHSKKGQNLQFNKETEKIFNFGGQNYQKFFLNQIENTNCQQKELDIKIYKMNQFRNIRFIINIVTSSQFTKEQRDPKKITKIIDELFNHIEQNCCISSVAIYIPNNIENDQYQNNNVIETYLNSIMNRLFNETNQLNQVQIVEQLQPKITQLNSILQNISKNFIVGQIKYKWQWKDGMKFSNYNDDVNIQLDDAYERFTQTNQEIKIQLKFEIESKPSTHSVDLQNLTMIELSSKRENQIIYQNKWGKISYYINNELLDDEYTQYFIRMYKKQCYQFEIFWKKLLVVINNQSMYQVNQQTNYQREIQRIPCDQDKVQSKQNITNQFDINTIQEYQNQFQIQSFNQNMNEKILIEINQMLQQSIINLKIEIPQISDKNLKNFTGYLETVALNFRGIINQGQTINIEILKKKQNKVLKQLELIKTLAKQYPAKWIKQNNNFVRVSIQQNSKEYNKIKNYFSKTDNGTIKAIFRIQNKSLWDNYIVERNKLFEICQKQKRFLLPKEQKRYLWHGVKNQHPQVIYQNLTEAFDVTFSNIGLWGQGIYFAENASYSRNYAYKITSQDDPNYANNLVFLCCLVTTGKIETRESSQNIKKPNDGFDCVSGYTQGSEIFVIYQMHVRRAYPAYEVIFS
ncbi:unnamed protein product [Paramecium sonneborni]|uniref:Poly [ADP-ribose] polymerase n=1 Tax=Paramecium sonneborni TaxID=65129 RepID=A0A8S1Q2V5_9CILI|nr:unnamed protein product [Paramecium sonneborni]